MSIHAIVFSGTATDVWGKQIIPTSSNGIDAVNFRTLKESTSLHFDDHIRGIAGAGLSPSGLLTPGLDDGMDLPDGDLFDKFSSVTLHYDGDR